MFEKGEWGGGEEERWWTLQCALQRVLTGVVAALVAREPAIAAPRGRRVRVHGVARWAAGARRTGDPARNRPAPCMQQQQHRRRPKTPSKTPPTTDFSPIQSKEFWPVTERMENIKIEVAPNLNSTTWAHFHTCGVDLYSKGIIGCIIEMERFLCNKKLEEIWLGRVLPIRDKKHNSLMF